MHGLALACGALTVVASAGVASAAVSVEQFNSDAAFLAEGFEEAWVAEARNVSSLASEQNSDWELGLGVNTQAAGQFEQGNIVWVSGGDYSLELSLSGDDLSWAISLGGSEVASQSWSDASFSATQGVAIRLAGLNATNTVSFSEVSVDGSVAAGAAGSNAGGALYFVLSGSEFLGGFDLSADFSFAFDGNTVGSRPSFQIKGIVPAPGAAALAGVAGLAAVRRRR